MSGALEKCLRNCPANGLVLDVGCLGFRQFENARRLGCVSLKHFGVDQAEPTTELPEPFVFKQADLNREPIPFEDDMFDLVVASHVVEHLRDPIEFFGECMRVCKPGGRFYLEAPSERALFLPGMPFAHEWFCSLSFFDDPTHVSRPWTPQGLFRLAKYYSCEPVAARHIVSWRHRLALPVLLMYALVARKPALLESWCWLAVGWACYLVARKPDHCRGKPVFAYYIPSRSR